MTVAKHGNRAVSSRCGSADIFGALGVAVDAPPPVVERCLDTCGIAFLFAPTFHPSMRHAAPTRRELGVRTVFNLLGPLTNPAGVARQLVGVSRPDHTDLLARALADLGTERAWVAHGADGLDEISTTGHTKVSECRGGVIRSFFLHPDDFGLPVARIEDIRAESPADNEAIARDVLAGRPGPPRDMVLANAAAGLFITERAGSPREGVAMAAAALDDGRARETLDRLVAATAAGNGGGMTSDPRAGTALGRTGLAGGVDRDRSVRVPPCSPGLGVKELAGGVDRGPSRQRHGRWTRAPAPPRRRRTGRRR